jgi:uncharacterized Zn finger protein (UPF0148 family)
MPFWQVHITDDRQQRVTLLRTADARGDFELAEVLMRFQETSRLGNERLRWEHLFVVLGVIALAVITALLSSWLFAGASMAYAMSLQGLMFGGLAIFLFHRSRRRYSHRLVESLLRIGACPSCGYRLGGAMVEADGAVVCPECAAAWKAERVGSQRPDVSWAICADAPADMPPMVERTRRMWARQSSVVDDRDRVMAFTSLAIPEDANADRRLRLMAGREAVQRSTRLRRLLLFIGVLVMMAMMCLPIGRLVFGGGLGLSRWIALIYLPMLAMYAVFAWRALTGRSSWTARPARNAFLRERLCPGCSADLRTRTTEPDGCVTCPTCTAAWRMPQDALTNRASTPNATSV